MKDFICGEAALCQRFRQVSEPCSCARCTMGFEIVLMITDGMVLQITEEGTQNKDIQPDSSSLNLLLMGLGSLCSQCVPVLASYTVFVLTEGLLLLVGPLPVQVVLVRHGGRRCKHTCSRAGS